MFVYIHTLEETNIKILNTNKKPMPIKYICIFIPYRMHDLLLWGFFFKEKITNKIFFYSCIIFFICYVYIS